MFGGSAGNSLANVPVHIFTIMPGERSGSGQFIAGTVGPSVLHFLGSISVPNGIFSEADV